MGFLFLVFHHRHHRVVVRWQALGVRFGGVAAWVWAGVVRVVEDAVAEGGEGFGEEDMVDTAVGAAVEVPAVEAGAGGPLYGGFVNGVAQGAGGVYQLVAFVVLVDIEIAGEDGGDGGGLLVDLA